MEKNKIITFLYSILSGIRLNLGGQLGVNEILAILSSTSIRSLKILYKNIPGIQKVNIAYGIFLLSQIISDVINQSPTQNYLRGWANILVAIIVTNFLAKNLWKSYKIVIYYLAGEMVQFLIWGQRDEQYVLSKLGENMGIFKTWIAPIANSGLLIISWYLIKVNQRNQRICVAIFILYGLTSIFLDYRSNGIFWILTATVLISRSMLSKINLRNSITFIVLSALLFQGLYSIYVFQVLSGNIGGLHSKQQMERIKNPYNAINLLRTGRSETFVGLVAIGDKPIFGHGSWASDRTLKYTYMAYLFNNMEDKFSEKIETIESIPIIPSHSVLVGAWMNSGIIGFLAVLYLFIFIVNNFLQILTNRKLINKAFFPITIYYFFYTMWAFLFSPLPHIKQTLPIIIAFSVVLCQKQNGNNDRKRVRYLPLDTPQSSVSSN